MSGLASLVLELLSAVSGAVGLDLDRDPRPTSWRTTLVALAFLAGIVVAALALTALLFWLLL